MALAPDSSPHVASPNALATLATGDRCPVPPVPLDFPPDVMRRMGSEVVERAARHIESLDSAPARGDYTGIEELCRALQEPVPEAPGTLAPLLDLIFDELVPRSFNTISPGYLAYIPGGGLYPAALADYIANTVNRYTGVWVAAPGLVQLEANALRWLCDAMHYPAASAGVFTPGGSMATFNAILCARERLLGDALREGVLYTSDQSHHSVAKSARLAGILPDRVRHLPVDGEFRLRPDALDDAVAADRRTGLRPFMVVSSAGTTNTGAVDPLDAVADIAAREGLWHHVDGAYGACFHLVPSMQPLLRGLPRADSITLDPHKGLFLPYGTGALLVRDGEALRQVHAASAGYLPENQQAFYDPAQYGPELSRGYPGLRVWLTLKLVGAATYRAALEEKRALALWGADAIARIPGVVMDAWPQLSAFAFHLEGASLPTRDAENAATTALMERVTARGRVMITGCTIDGRVLARICVLGFRTHAERLEACVDDVRAVAAELLGAGDTAR